MILWGSLFSQQYTNYTTKDGLPSNHVYRITQDIEGFIWFITDKGMVKYNGSDFKKFTIRDGLPINDIWNIAITPNGKVWYFSKSPKIGYIYKDSVYAFPSENKGEILSPMNRNIVGNEVTFNNSFAHYQLENKQWKAYNVSGRNSKLKQYKSYLNHKKLHRIQFSEDQKNLFFIDKNKHEVKKIKLVQEITEAHTRGQINDSTYFWTSNKAFTILNLNNYKVKTTYFKDVINIKESKHVRIHIVNNQIQITGRGFVSILDKEYNITKTHYVSKDLKAHFSFIDKQDNIWIATFRNGVYKLPKAKQNAVYTLINEKVGKIKKIDNKLIAKVLDKGFYAYDFSTKQFKVFIKETNFVYGMFPIKELNKNFFITHNSIFLVKNKKRNEIPISLRANLNETARQLVYHKDYLYGNFTAGLNKINPKNFSVKKEYIINGIRSFVSFKDTLLIASSNGLQVLDNDRIKALKIPKETANNLYTKPILNLNKLDDNAVLVGTDAYGAFVTDLNEIIPLKETEYLSINNSFVAGTDLWLATDKGIWHYQKNRDNKYIFITSYNENDGLLSNNTNSVYATENELIISSNNGVVSIPKKKNKTSGLLAIYVAEVNYNNESILKSPLKYESNNSLSIKVSSIDFSENRAMQYAYQLLPIQKKWITTTSRQISFNDLPPNTYQLNIKAKSKSDSIAFKIAPLWNQTLVAKVLFALLSIVLVSTLVLIIRKIELKKQAKKLNAKRKLAEFELYALRSQMNPHFVFNSLNAIQYYLTDNKIDLSEKYLVKFSRLIRMFFDLSKHQTISIQDEVGLLNAYLEIEKMRFGKDFKYKIQIDKALNTEKQIPAMLLQPIVENAVNHGLFHKQGKGLISIHFHKTNESDFSISIEDNGIGRERSKEIKKHSLNKHLSKSTQILQERIDLINESGSFNIHYKITDLNQVNQTGTRVRLQFKHTQTSK